MEFLAHLIKYSERNFMRCCLKDSCVCVCSLHMEDGSTILWDYQLCPSSAILIGTKKGLDQRISSQVNAGPASHGPLLITA